MTASESARIEAAIAGDHTMPEQQREALRASNRAHAARALPWVLWGNPNKLGGEQR